MDVARVAPRSSISSGAMRHLRKPFAMECTVGMDVDRLTRVFPITEDEDSLQAVEFIAKGTVIGVFDGTREKEKTRFTLCVGDDIHILNAGKFTYMNHACEPNVGFAWPERSFTDLPVAEVIFPRIVALRDIQAGEDITFHYCITEYTMASPFSCRCRSTRCVGTVQGYAFLNDQQRKDIDDILAPHVRRVLSREGELLTE